MARLLEDPAQAGDLPRAVVTGSAQALDLWAWGREQAIERLAGDEDRVRVQGDSAAIAQVEQLIAEGHD